MVDRSTLTGAIPGMSKMPRGTAGRFSGRHRALVGPQVRESSLRFRNIALDFAILAAGSRYARNAEKARTSEDVGIVELTFRPDRCASSNPDFSRRWVVGPWVEYC